MNGVLVQDALNVFGGFVKKEMADCPKFELNMSPNAAFGTCTCGRPRAEHTDAALAHDEARKAAVRKESEELRREMGLKQEAIGAAVESQGTKTEVKYGIGNTKRTAADEEAAINAAVNARAGGADKAAAIKDLKNVKTV